MYLHLPLELLENEQEDDTSAPKEYLSLTSKVLQIESLQNIQFLEIMVDTTLNSISNLGILFPNLKHLKLNNSILSTLRDLGTSLLNLEILSVSRCNLSNLDGISSLKNLKELYISYNNIEELSPLGLVENLEVIDLEGNHIADIDQLYALCNCDHLYNLNLENNAITKLSNYRQTVLEIVTQLKILDDTAVQSSSLLDSIKKETTQELELVKDAIKTTNRLEQDGFNFQTEPLIIATSFKANPTTADLQLNSQVQKRPSSALPIIVKEFSPHTTSPLSSGRRTVRPSSAFLRPASASIRGRNSPTTSPMKPSQNNNSNTVLTDEPIDLTFGSSQIVCGNLISSIRKRKQEIANRELFSSINEEVLCRINQVKIDDSMADFDEEESYESESQITNETNTSIITRTDLIRRRPSSSSSNNNNSSISVALDKQQQRFRRSPSKELINSPERNSYEQVNDQSPKSNVESFRRTYIKK